MILPIEWLKDFCKTEKKSSEIADIFHSIGFTPDKITDDYLDLEITPNRGDTVSVYGLAREINAFLNQTTTPYSKPSGFIEEEDDIVFFNSETARTNVPVYAYFVAEGPTPKKSPSLIAERLKQININPKNNIVDLTNYLMHEYGLPLHAFDLEKVNRLEIGFGQHGEKAILLGDTEIEIKEENLVARSKNTIVDLVGISGCVKSSVTQTTSKILIQAAIFTPAVIRKSAKIAGVQTPASYRYERGVDPQAPIYALEKAAQTLENWGYRIQRKKILIQKPIQENIISFDYSLIPAITGANISETMSRNILARLGFKLSGKEVIVPSWRVHDVKSPVDIAEEVARIYGYHHITPNALSSNFAIHTQGEEGNTNRLITTLAEMGLTEVKSTSFISKKEARAFALNEKDLVEIEKPLSAEYIYMRPLLAPKMFEAVSKNPWYDQFTIFEVGSVFTNGEEVINLAAASTSKNHRLGEIFPPSSVVRITPDTKTSQLYKIKRSFFFAEIPIEKISLSLASNRMPTTNNRYRTISKYPPVVRDISFLIESKIAIGTILDDVSSLDNSILIVEPLDEFESPKFEGRKSMTLRITYQKPDNTLTAEEADTRHDKVRDHLTKKYQVSIRE